MIDGLSHDGRGVAVYGNSDIVNDDSNNDVHATAILEAHNPDKTGKKVFVGFALPNETVNVKLTNSRKTFEEGDAVEVLANPHPERQTPPCPHFGVCGGAVCNIGNLMGKLRLSNRY